MFVNYLILLLRTELLTQILLNSLEKKVKLKHLLIQVHLKLKKDFGYGLISTELIFNINV